MNENINSGLIKTKNRRSGRRSTKITTKEAKEQNMKTRISGKTKEYN
jgi:hypothetical protein